MLLEPLPLSSRSLTFAALGLALLAGGCDRESAETVQPEASATATRPPPGKGKELTGTIDRSHKGETPPALVLKDPAGRELKLAGIKGPLLLNLWATWCVPCVTELPLLDKLARDRAGDLKVLAVSGDTRPGPEVAAFLQERGLARLEPWLDPQNDLAFHFGGNLPTTVYYDSTGREVWRFIGGFDWSSAAAAAMLAEGR